MNKSSPKLSAITIALLSAMGTASFGASADLTESISNAVTEGKTTINLRYRYENVDQDGIAEDASASTLKTRLTWKSGQAGLFSAKIEVDDVTALGDDEYNSTANGRSEYPVVADPEGTEINQAYLQFKQGSFVFTGGRQRVVHNDQRFVGGVAWRQNEQTYDGYRAQFKATDALSIDYSYIFNVNRIFGPDGAKGDMGGDINLFNAVYDVSKGHKLAFFVYGIEFDSTKTENAAAAATAKALSSNTYGIRYTGKVSNVKLSASYAKQTEAGENMADYSADYMAFEAGTKLGQFNVALGYENLGGDNGVGFKTPLATLHKFQGFADKFLATPGTGIEDIYIKAGTKFGKVGLTAVWHDLKASEGSMDLGTELDFVASYAFNKKVKGLLKYATYDADGAGTDTDKLWAMLNVKF